MSTLIAEGSDAPGKRPVGIVTKAPLSAVSGFLLRPQGAPPAVEQLDVEAIIEEIKRRGAVMLQGFSLDVPAFERLSDRFRCEFADNLGSGSLRETVNGATDGTIQNVAYRYGEGRQRTFPLPLHADRAYVKSSPHAMFFFCQRPAASGGQTTIADGLSVYKGLSDRTRALFDTTRVKYIRHYGAHEWPLLYRTQDLDQVREYCARNDMTLRATADGSIRTEFVTSAVPLTRWQRQPAFCNSVQIGYWQEHALRRKINYVRFEDDREIPASVMAEVDEVSAALTVEVPWESGDLVIVDNTRMLHGRRRFDDEQRAVMVRMASRVHW
ncbi:MAG: TauD/TfdA family dioxygenase [Pseudomonadota bacterium]